MGSQGPPHHRAWSLRLGLYPISKVALLCAEPSAQFVFHASYFRYGKLGTAGDDPEANSYMLQWYPARIKEFIASQGGLTATPIYLEGRWMQQLVPACS